MKKTFFIAQLFVLAILAHAQQKVWEIDIPDEKQRYSNIYPDMNNPNVMYVSGDYTARQIHMDGKLGDLWEIGRNYASGIYFFSDGTKNYSLVHGVAYNLGNGQSNGNVLYASNPGNSKGVRENIFGKEKYFNLAAIHLVEGKLHAVLGGADYYNNRPKTSTIIVLDEKTQQVKTIPIAFPMMEADKLVESRTDKNRYIHSGYWREIAYDEESKESVIFRLSSVDYKATASIFTVNLLSGEVGGFKEISIPALNKYVGFSTVSVINNKDKKEFIVQLILDDNKKFDDAGTPELMLLKYNMAGELLGSKTHEFSDLSDKKITLLAKSDFITPKIQYDSFSGDYVMVWDAVWGKPLANHFAILNSDLSLKSVIPSVEYIALKKADTPTNLPDYWLYYYSKGAEFGLPGFSNIYFGDGFVLMKHHSNTQKKVVITCFR